MSASGAAGTDVSGANGGFSCSIGVGAQASGYSSSYTFGANTCIVTGGSGTFTYAWSEHDDGFATWTSSASTSAASAPSVSRVTAALYTSSASYVCTVTDTVSGAVIVSNVAGYSWTNIKGSGN